MIVKTGSDICIPEAELIEFAAALLVAAGVSRPSGRLVAEALVAAGTGAGVGLAGAFGLTRLIRSQLYGVQPTDPTTLTAVMALMVLIALAAAFVPTRRAARVDPMLALRAE